MDPTHSFLRFLKAATGGAHLSWRQWIIPLKMSELPRAYPLLWALVVVLVAGMTDRWFLGLKWFDLVSSGRWLCFCAAEVIGLGTYFSWLWVTSRRTENGV